MVPIGAPRSFGTEQPLCRQVFGTRSLDQDTLCGEQTLKERPDLLEFDQQRLQLLNVLLAQSAGRRVVLLA